MQLSLDIYQSVAMAIVVYLVGNKLKKKIKFIEKYCIPSAVVGGVLFALLTLVLNNTGVLTIETDNTMRNVFMTLFFTSIGYTASLKLLKKGGFQVMVFAGISTILVVLQNGLGITLAKFFGLNAFLGLSTGSVSMIGGHGTAGSLGDLFETMGVSGAATVAMASATFGLVMGGIIGGPLAEHFIRRRNLKSEAHIDDNGIEDFTEEKLYEKPTADQIFHAFAMLFLAAGVGSVVSYLIELTGITFPSYVGAMLAAALFRNLSDVTKKINIMEDIIVSLGNASLSLFLAMALMSLKLWELANLALPMVIMLFAQTVLMLCFASFVTFRVMGKNYEAAVMASAHCGFGMGATPNAIANMQAITTKYGPAPRAMFVVPLVGSLFIDFINSTVITIFINFIS